MVITDAVLRDRAERCFDTYPATKGLIKRLDVPGVQGHLSTISHPLANIVTAARLDADNVDRTIDEVIHEFDSLGLPFAWIVGQASTPADLNDRLEARSITKVEEMALLVLTDLGTFIRSNPAIHVRELSLDELEGLMPELERSSEVPADVLALFMDVARLNEETICSRTYLASIDGQPASWAKATYRRGDPIVQLSGAGTLPEYRGRGAYSSLVARRISDARADGVSAALIQARLDTSAPICRKLGFRDMGSLDFRVHVPPV